MAGVLIPVFCHDLRRFDYVEVRMDKQKMTVRVAGREYALVTSDSPEHLTRVAAYVDRQISETIFATRQPRETVAVLVAMNITDELMKDARAGQMYFEITKVLPLG